jgi:O-antigen ligase
MATLVVAILGWGLVMRLAPAPALERAALRATAPLLVFFGMAGAACLASILAGVYPSSLGAAVLGVLALGALVTLHGAGAGASGDTGFVRAFAIALVVCGLCQAVVAMLQVFDYDQLDNVLIAIPTRRGRAGGNTGQPNQFADTMLWGLIALVPLARSWHGESAAGRVRLARAGWCAAALLMILGIVLCGTRTGLVALVVIAVWGIADRRLARPLRIGLAIAPLVDLVVQWLVGAWSRWHDVAVVLFDRSGTDVTSHRAAIWGQGLALIKEQPWLGVGWGQFNFAWTLTPFADRTAGLVDNAHDLPLQLAVEMGIPAAIIMMLLLVWALRTALRRVWRLAGEEGVYARSTLMLVVVMGMHSMFEYPLWYVYLLLPTAWAFGLALGVATREDSVAEPAPGARPPVRAWRVVGTMFAVIAASAWLDYQNIVALFEPTATSLPLPERIQHARQSPLFANLADRVAVVDMPPSPAMMPAIHGASHVLFDGRILYVWANLLNAEGQVDKARYLAARLREFDLSGPKPWYAPCDDPAITAKPFQCLPPEHPVTWRDFR